MLETLLIKFLVSFPSRTAPSRAGISAYFISLWDPQLFEQLRRLAPLSQLLGAGVPGKCVRNVGSPAALHPQNGHLDSSLGDS